MGTEITVSRFDPEKHYSILKSWWEKYSFPILQLELLPPNCFMSYKKDTPLAFAALYKTDGIITVLTWYCGNPDVTWQERSEGLHSVIDHAIMVSKEMGFTLVFTMAENDRLTEKLISSGFVLGDKKINNFFRRT